MAATFVAKDILKWAHAALTTEAEAIQLASGRLDGAFVKAVETILGIQGKVVLTGLGKSGHVARKIAATLASTGTAAFFVHPSEALHGDAGMIESKDALVALAFGGETREVLEVVKFARRIGAPVIAITGSMTSSLASAADMVIDGSVHREACPLNLAPTSSTTVALALGDALAVALMKARGFREEDFARYHPDGHLGRKLSTVEQHMVPIAREACLRPDDDLREILAKVTRNNFGISVVLSAQESILGVITDGDVRRAIMKHESKIFGMKAQEIMSTAPKRIASRALALDAISLMEEKKITALIVVDERDENTLKGIVRMHDLLAAKIV